MPTYQYRCGACKHEFEELQSIKEEPLTKCPQCKKKKLNRLLGTGAGLIFKGSGFYITDYRSDSYKSAAKADAKAGDSTGSGENKSDSGGKTATGKSDAAGGSAASKGGKISKSGAKGKSD